MSKNFKLFLGFTYLLVLAAFLYLIFSSIQIDRLSEFSYYKELQISLNNFVTDNLLIVSVFSMSLGALALYSIASFFFNDIVKNILERKFQKYIRLFQKNEFYYFFIFRFTGGLGTPFFLQNLLPVLFNMKKINYFLSSFLGFVPGFFVFNTIGAGLNNYVEDAESFNFFELILTSEIYVPILMFIALMFLSLMVKKKYFKNAN